MGSGGRKILGPSAVLVLAFMASSVAYGAPGTTRLVVEARYFADSMIGDKGLVRGRFPIDRPVHPFRRVAARLMKRLHDPGAVLHISAQGLALGSIYDFMENRARLRRLRYIGAVIEGRLSLSRADAGMTCAADFAGSIEPPKGSIIVGVRDVRESPQFAPFEAALAEPGSFVAALTAVIGAMNGQIRLPFVDCAAPPVPTAIPGRRRPRWRENRGPRRVGSHRAGAPRSPRRRR